MSGEIVRIYEGEKFTSSWRLFEIEKDFYCFATGIEVKGKKVAGPDTEENIKCHMRSVPDPKRTRCSSGASSNPVSPLCLCEQWYMWPVSFSSAWREVRPLTSRRVLLRRKEEFPGR